MSLLGKILAFFNILAGIGLMALAAMDWSQHQAWSYAVFRHDVAIDGLPLEDDERDSDGVLKVARMGKKALQDIFQAAGGLPVNTQHAEVDRLQSQFREQISKLDGDQAKRQRLQELLLPLATTGAERDELRSLLEERPVDELLAEAGPFAAAFKRGSVRRVATGPGTGRDRDIEERKQEIAHLLFNLAQVPGQPASSDQRVVVVVGLKAYTAEANRQAAALRDMDQRLATLMLADRSTFEQEYRRSLHELEVLVENIKNRDLALQEQRGLRARHEVLKNVRLEDVKTLKKNLEEARLKTEAQLIKQASEEKLLFEAQRSVQQLTGKNVRLEREMQSLERNERREGQP